MTDVKHTLTLKFGRVLSKDEWRAVITVVRSLSGLNDLPVIQGLVADTEKGVDPKLERLRRKVWHQKKELRALNKAIHIHQLVMQASTQRNLRLLEQLKEERQRTTATQSVTTPWWQFWQRT